ncbi:D-amino acid dehydrogenase [Roseicella frigidaeris]|uniref:D-amino acid dehydrogenase n=1 Tax=Roseicella frigidaeris TaxID=2230885 RepID=A0A327MAJ4_9PROT|nr:D-amino acid dehydrogenase [Roseicella frigidaeris]RAI59527.1 D-amino acid dehydrogenase [Roseicella frigidaeris]
MSTIAVIGSGITGVTTAYALLQRGHRVVVLDRQRYAGMETSFANGGQLSACNAEVWNSTATILKGMKWMLKADAPLLLNPRPGLHKYSWLGEFVSHIRHYRANTTATTRLAIEARKYLFSIAEQEGIDFDVEHRGILHVYRDKPGFDAAARVNALLTEGGLDRRAVTPAEMQAIEPALQGRWHGGFFTPSDATGDIHKYTRGLAEACLRRGARFLFEADVTGITHDAAGIAIAWRPAGAAQAGNPVALAAETLRADAVVVCAGVASRRFAAMLGDRINVYPVKGYSITVQLDDAASQAAAPTVSLLDDATKIVTSRLGRDRFRVAGTAEFNGENRDIRMDRIRPLVRWTEELFPGVSTARVVPWAGLRPMTPNLMPRIGAGRRPGVFYNTGHGHLGWTLSAATAQMVAEAIGTAPAADLRRAA